MPVVRRISTCLSCPVCLALLLPAAAIAGPGELRVTGHILPAVCLPSLGGAGNADFGSIGQDRFRGRKQLVLPPQLVPFDIKCDVPMRVSLKPGDNHASSADDRISEALAQQNEPGQGADVFGLGHEGADRLGGYVVRFVQSTLMGDGRRIEAIAASDGERWSRRAGGVIRQGVSNAWAEPGSTVPGAYGSISGMLQIRPVLNTLERQGNDTHINGSLTLELEYL